jgi:hypothetical protein
MPFILMDLTVIVLSISSHKTTSFVKVDKWREIGKIKYKSLTNLLISNIAINQ